MARGYEYDFFLNDKFDDGRTDVGVAQVPGYFGGDTFVGEIAGPEVVPKQQQ
jgi:hypothetical protein